MTHLVIGSKGQVGSALFEVLSKPLITQKNEVTGIDLGDEVSQTFDVVHICIPYNEHFEVATAAYLDRYLSPGGLPIIHSTVALGTSALFNAVHSPIRGVHPNLAEGICRFTKFFGGVRAQEAANIFEHLVDDYIILAKSEETEAMKLWDTTYYGWNIIFEKAVKAYCDEHNLDFHAVYTLANETYNKTYLEMGMKHVCRPVLKDYPGKIGGHCVIPNAKLLQGDIADFILKKNEEY